MKTNIVYIWAVLSYLNLTAFAYGYLGHYVIGEVTYRTLPEESLNYLEHCDYLKPFNGSLGLASVWADVVKRKPKYRWTSVLHYYDIDNDPPLYCGRFEPPRNNRSLNLYNEIDRALRNATTCQQSPMPCCASNFHGNMLWHLLQDFYQPLHLTGKGRGGNEVWFVKDGKKYNLHRFWDSDVLNLLLRDAVGENYTDAQAVDYFYDEIFHLNLSERTCNITSMDADVISGYIFAKAQNILETNCQLVWNTDKDDYIQLSKQMVQRFIIDSIVTLNCVIRSLSSVATLHSSF